MRITCVAILLLAFSGCSPRVDLTGFEGTWTLSEEEKTAALEEADNSLDPRFYRGVAEMFNLLSVEIRPIDGGLELEATIAQHELLRIRCMFRQNSSSGFIFAVDSPELSWVRLRLPSRNQIEISFGQDGEFDRDSMFAWKLTRKPESNPESLDDAKPSP